MRTFLPGLVFLFSFSIAWAEPAPRGWINNYQEGKKEAARTGKPIFLAFRCDP